MPREPQIKQHKIKCNVCSVVLCVILFIGDKNSVLVEPTEPDIVHNLTSLKLIDLKGTEFQEIPLHPVENKPGLYRGSMFLPPNDFFHLGVSTLR
jgi:hypothetical protein